MGQSGRRQQNHCCKYSQNEIIMLLTSQRFASELTNSSRDMPQGIEGHARARFW